MAKRNYGGATEEKIKEYIKQGYGQGRGKDYKPWIEIHDFPSKGRVTRSFAWKTGRTHHLMSDLETRYFYMLQWADIVVDIREQYPILERELAIRIAENKGIRYPVDPQNNVPIVLTTDFMITVNINGKLIDIARTVKPSSDLEKIRVIDKFEIERAYWEQKGIDWGIVTEKELSKIMALNIEWAYSAYSLEDTNEQDIETLIQLSLILKNRLKSSNEKIQNILNKLDIEMNVHEGTFLYLFKYLIATKQIKLNNIKEKINISKTVDWLIKAIV